jgi:hypothetical protein
MVFLVCPRLASSSQINNGPLVIGAIPCNQRVVTGVTRGVVNTGMAKENALSSEKKIPPAFSKNRRNEKTLLENTF